MSNNPCNIPILPFDQLVELHKNGQLGDYAEQKTREFISRCRPTQANSARLESLAFKLSAIRARHPKGLKAYLEINELLQACQYDFQGRLKQVVQKSSPKSEKPNTARILDFPGHSTSDSRT